ncbi:MAG TPA: amino acid adenylation domain-containing protein [Ktedonobacteraceae bacterium]
MSQNDIRSARISQLSPKKQALLRQWQQKKQAFGRGRPKISPRTQQGALPLSFAQQRLWFIDQLVPGTAAYNGTLAVRLTGPLDREALSRGLDEIVRRHEILRTIFPGQDGEPAQVILPAQPLPLPLVSLHDFPAERREEEAERITLEEDQKPFDLGRGPLLRALLLHLDQEHHILLVMLHHMICDGLSTEVFVRELTQLYADFRAGRPASLPELPVQYADFTLWERERVREELEEHQAYWKRQLEGAPPVLNLPTDRPYPAVRTFSGNMQRFTLSPHLTEAIKTLSRKEGTTVFTTLLTAFQVLLSRYSGQKDIVIGTPTANRPLLETESLVGFFASTLVLRINLSDNPPFLEALARVREVLLESTTHQDVPFERLVDELHIERTMSHNPLFQVMFNFGNPPKLEQTSAGLVFDPKYARGNSSMFDLWLTMGERGDILSGTLEYNTDIYDDATIARMIEHFRVLLASAISAPYLNVVQLAYLTARERQQLLQEWNATSRPYDLDTCLHTLFQEQVLREPNAPALTFENNHLTYAQLDQRANQLAHLLRAQGVGPEVIVGICLERSLEMVIGLLAILKAGGAYLPLDPTLPADRLSFMLEDARTPLVLAQQRYTASLSVDARALLILDSKIEQERLSTQPASAPEQLAIADNAAYMIYTSGSTGKPKGAVITHRGIVNRLIWMQEAYGLRAEDNVLQKTPFSFDVSVWEFFWPLLYGARLVIARPEGHRDSAYLVDLIAREAITTIHFVPSMLQLFLEEKELERCAALRRVICSGEALPLSLQERYFQRLDAELYNLYGPTEAAVDVTAWKCQRDSLLHTVSLGYPIANIQIYLLDQQLDPVPLGVPGELCIGGIGLARGYFNRPELTAEKFIPDPFSSQPGSRLYRTGDLARYLPDGALEFLGRLDNQVKLRGFRIELGEIEATLSAHPNVHEAVVVASEMSSGDRKLIAYVVPSARQEAQDATILLSDQVQHWQQVFEQTYQEPTPGQEETFNIVGWNSSYTGQPLPAEEMQEWVDTTVARILSLGPQHVLEIGCGTGLLLFPLAPRCASYTGTDFSPAGLAYIRQQLAHAVHEQSNVTLLQRQADDLADLPADYFDTIILNSVIQYFPNLEYLVTVLSKVASLLRPGGRIFIGDVRSLPLLEAFHTAVACAKADNAVSARQLRQHIHHGIVQENELVIDPAFFLALKHWLPRVGDVQLQIKRGKYTNELTQFRYDVSIQFGEVTDKPLEVVTHDWKSQAWTPATLRQYLQEAQPEVVHITSVPDARLAQVMQMQHMLAEQEDAQQACALTQAMQVFASGIDPEELWSIGDDLPYVVDLCPAVQEVGAYDVVLLQRTSPGASSSVRSTAHFLLGDTSLRARSTYANNPLSVQLAGHLVPTLRNHLKAKLPDYMVPSFFVMLDAFPLNANGKVDYRALPEPDMAYVVQDAFVAPRTPVERILTEIWAQILGIELVGINDNYFNLGGDSITSIRIVARVQQAGLHLTPRLLFQYQTIAELAEVIEPLPVAARPDPNTERVLEPPCQLTPPAGDGYTPANFPLARLTQQQLDELFARDQEIEDIYPLAPMQRNILFQRLHSQNPELYWLCAILRLSNTSLNIPAFQQAWQLVVNQHPTMRTTMIWNGLEEPLQIVHRHASMEIECHDWRHLSAEEQDQRVFDYYLSVRRQGAPLSSAPHMKTTLFQITDSDYYMFRASNYMLQDGWSSTLVTRDFDAFYEALCQGRKAQVERSRPYRDFIAWLQRQDYDKAERHFRAALQGFQEPTPLLAHLPTNPHAPDQDSLAYHKEFLWLAPETTSALQALTRTHHVTMGALLYSVWGLILSQYSGCEDIVFGSVCAGRPTSLPEAEYIVGMFNNILPLRIQVSRRATLLSLWQHVQEQIVELREYEWNSSLDIQKWAGFSEKQLLFESYIAYANLPLYNYEDVGAQKAQDFGQSVMDDTRMVVPSEYPLRIEFRPMPVFSIRMSCYQHYMSAAALQRLIGHFQTALESIVANPYQLVQDLLALIKTEQIQ